MTFTCTFLFVAWVLQLDDTTLQDSAYVLSCTPPQNGVNISKRYMRDVTIRAFTIVCGCSTSLKCLLLAFSCRSHGCWHLEDRTCRIVHGFYGVQPQNPCKYGALKTHANTIVCCCSTLLTFLFSCRSHGCQHLDERNCRTVHGS